tara:strand:- start:120 stop:635 length:516 start_codon:yes stop_codon:yes gene_type:complete
LDSKELMYSAGKNDECFTPAYAVEPILEFIPKDAIVWCPFDTPDSEFLIRLADAGIDTVASHINDGRDFFEYEPEHYDCIVSNPPFTNKRAFFQRALDLGKPFALLMANTWLNDRAPMQLFEERGLQLLLLDRRTEFVQPHGGTSGKITFSSSYFCCDLLPRDIIIKRIYP